MSQVGGLPSLFGISGEVITSAAEIAPSLPIPLTLLGGGKKKRTKKNRKRNRKSKVKRGRRTSKVKRGRRTSQVKRVRKTLHGMRASLKKSLIKDQFDL